MGKVYLRKSKNKNDVCNGCYFDNGINIPLCKNDKFRCKLEPNVIFKKISEKHAKKLLKSGKCKIVSPSE